MWSQQATLQNHCYWAYSTGKRTQETLEWFYSHDVNHVTRTLRLADSLTDSTEVWLVILPLALIEKYRAHFNFTEKLLWPRCKDSFALINRATATGAGESKIACNRFRIPKLFESESIFFINLHCWLLSEKRSLSIFRKEWTTYQTTNLNLQFGRN